MWRQHQQWVRGLDRGQKRNRAIVALLPESVLLLFPWCNFISGLLSFIYHASNFFLTQILDFVGMFALTSCVLAAALERRRRLHKLLSLKGRLSRDDLSFFDDGHETARALKIIAIATIVQTLPLPLLYAHDIKFQALIFVNIVIIIALEFALIAPLEKTAMKEKVLTCVSSATKQEEDVISQKDFIAALCLLAVAGVCSLVDVKRILCFPEQHYLHGHAAWHVLSAAGMFYVWKHLSRRAGLI